MRNPSYDRGDLGEHLQALRAKALEWVAKLPEDTLLTEHIEVLVAEPLEKFAPPEVVIAWDSMTRTSLMESSMRVQDRFDGRNYNVPSMAVSWHCPVAGDAKLLKYQASSFTLSPLAQFSCSDGLVSGGHEDRELKPEHIERAVSEWRSSLQMQSQRVNADLTKHRDELDRTLRAAIEARRTRILTMREVGAAVSIPLHRAGVGEVRPLRIERKVPNPAERRANATFVPEPALDEAEYEDIIRVSVQWARDLERRPGTAHKLHEEDLRNLLLSVLNSHWLGSATGETFNGEGKTDILVRAENRNAFIGECKIWSGPKAAGEAVDQLLSYLVWRDSKAGLIMFIRQADTSRTIASLHSAVAAHPNHLRTLTADPDPARMNFLLRADDEGRTVKLAVLPVVLGAP